MSLPLKPLPLVSTRLFFSGKSGVYERFLFERIRLQYNHSATSVCQLPWERKLRDFELKGERNVFESDYIRIEEPSELKKQIAWLSPNFTKTLPDY